MSLTKEPATGAQYAQYGLLIAQSVVEKMGEQGFSKAEMQELLTGSQKGKSKEITQAIVAQICGIEKNTWDRQKEKLTKFWKEQFNHDIDWNKLVLPKESKGFDVLEYIPKCFTEDDIFAKCQQIFGFERTEKGYENIHDSIRTQEARPEGDYLILHRGGERPDMEHLNTTYSEIYHDDNRYMIPIEGLIASLRYYLETNKTMKEITFFSALDSASHHMFMCIGTTFMIKGTVSGGRSRKGGHREIVL